VISNPFVWHFGFHSIPELPERLVRHDLRAYFDYFFTAIAARPEAITDAARERYVASYAAPSALTQGFAWYRALWADAEQNAGDRRLIEVPTLYLRGSEEPGDLAAYERGLREAGLQRVTAQTVSGAGHFTPEEAPQEVWSAISRHLAAAGSGAA
jgi:pimeloyl-ACP methyl ester carboxylesterase